MLQNGFPLHLPLSPSHVSRLMSHVYHSAVVLQLHPGRVDDYYGDDDDDRKGLPPKL